MGMKVRVTENGVLVPRQFLDNAIEVEIRRERGMVVVVPVCPQDPILSLGTSPVALDIPDASTMHDSLLYGCCDPACVLTP